MRCTAHTVEPPNNGQLGDEILSMFRSCPFFGDRNVYRQGVNSVSHYERFHCIYQSTGFVLLYTHLNAQNTRRNKSTSRPQPLSLCD